MPQTETHLRTQAPEDQPSDPWRTLALAVIVQALKDLRSPRRRRRQEALAWLHSPGCATYCLALEIDHQVLLERVCYIQRAAPPPQGRGHSPRR